MKKLLLSILIGLLFYSVSIAQTEVEKKSQFSHEISLTFADLLSSQASLVYPIYDVMFAPYSSYIPYMTYQSPARVGLMYKLNFTKHSAIRFGTALGFTSDSYDNQDDYYWSKNSQLVSYSKLGYQYKVIKDRVGFFFGMDGLFSANTTTSESKNTNPGEYYYYSRYKTALYKYGMAPFMGISWSFSEHLALSAETNYAILFTRNTNYSEDQTQTGSQEYDNAFTGFETGFLEIGILSLTYTF